MRRDRIDPLLLEPVELASGGPVELRVADEQRDLLFGRCSQIEALREPPGELYWRCVLTGGLQDQRREQEPLGVDELRVFGRGDRVRRGDLLDPVDQREAQDLRRINQRRIGAAATHRFRELRERAFEHARRLEKAPRAHVTLFEHREQLWRGFVVPTQ